MHGSVGEPSGLRHTFTETYDAREGIDDAEAAPRRACQKQPAIVGAEIQRPVDGTLINGLRRTALIVPRMSFGLFGL
jgi:hypothetical protein